jgi:membrane protein required for colicin V production
MSAPSGAAVLAFAMLLLVPYAIFKLLANRMGEAPAAIRCLARSTGCWASASARSRACSSWLAFSILVLGYDTVWGAGGRPTWITQARTYPFVNAASEALVTMIADRRREAAEAEAAVAEKKD